MLNRRMAPFASLLFATFWAVTSWPWFATVGHPANNHLVPWLFCIFFVVVTGGLAMAKNWARQIGRAAAVLFLVVFLFVLVGSLSLPLFGEQPFNIRIASWEFAGAMLSFALIVLFAKPDDLASLEKQKELASSFDAEKIRNLRKYISWVEATFIALLILWALWAYKTSQGNIFQSRSFKLVLKTMVSFFAFLELWLKLKVKAQRREKGQRID